MKDDGYVIAIVGATGAVGAELVDCMAKRHFPVRGLRLLASARSAGKKMDYMDHVIAVQELRRDSFEGVDITFFSAGSGISTEYAGIAKHAGAIVIDNSSAFRMDPDVPLVVPEVNGDRLSSHRGIIANPNCVAAIASMVLGPLERQQEIKRIHMVTYQAASGAGASAVLELKEATAAFLRGEEYQPRVFRHPYAFNLFSHNAEIDAATGYNGEELKVIAELRRILDRTTLPIGVTCVRVPILRAHVLSVSVEFATPVSPEDVRVTLGASSGVRVVDDRVENHFPMPVEATGQDDVLVGRIRHDIGDPSGCSIAMLIAGDQLLKGAALNAVQIAETLASSRDLGGWQAV
ncbi:aspartate-semialdehyde dehydrogenase [Agrobacterium fabrum]|uniref:aspartate-semialdehyde dehydrogenase n=1 Tax=Agrobacterium fabrum TaxID=1176649 RepID=UPI003B9F136A